LYISPNISQQANLIADQLARGAMFFPLTGQLVSTFQVWKSNPPEPNSKNIQEKIYKTDTNNNQQ
jgi:hypothetical protein